MIGDDLPVENGPCLLAGTTGPLVIVPTLVSGCGIS